MNKQVSHTQKVAAQASTNQRQAYIIGFGLGASLVLCTFAFIFLTTTVSYKSSLFPGKHIALVAHRSAE